MSLSPLGIALSQQQPIMPAHPGQVSPTDVLGAFNLSSNMAEQQYQAKLAQQNAMWGGLAGLGSAGIIGASKIPAVQTAVGNWLTGGSSAAAPVSGAAGAPLSLLPGAATPAASNALDSSMLDYAAPSMWGGGAASGGVPLAGLDASTIGSGAADAALGAGAADAGTVAGADALAAAAPAAADAGAAGISTLADLLPFLFAA